MTPSKLERLRELQETPWRTRTDAQNDELEQLRTELAREQQEKADDPKTWLVNESRRPNLDGTDWNDFNRQQACDELVAIGLKLVATLGKAAAVEVMRQAAQNVARR